MDDNLDANGYELSVGDPVLIDEKERGEVVKFGGIGIFVNLEEDGAVLDFANHQVTSDA